MKLKEEKLLQLQSHFCVVNTEVKLGCASIEEINQLDNNFLMNNVYVVMYIC